MSGVVRCDRSTTARSNLFVQLQTDHPIGVMEPKTGRPEITGDQSMVGANRSGDLLHLYHQLIPFALVFAIMLQPLLVRSGEPIDAGYFADAS